MNAIESLIPLRDYQERRAHVFPSIESIRWYVRQQKSELVKAGALLEIAGRSRVDPSKFDDVVLAIGKRTMLAREAA